MHPEPKFSPQAAQVEKLLVKGRHGQFVALSQDLMIGFSLVYYGECHEDEWRFLRRFLNVSQVIADVGANLGTFTVPFATVVGPLGRVIAFEPQPVIYGCLRETVAINQLTNVELHHCCVGNGNYELEIAEPDYNRPGNFGGLPFKEEDRTQMHYSSNRIRTHCVTLDGVLKGSRLDFLKIDVEGMELEVLEGAEATIAKHKPVIFVENNRPLNSPPLLAFLQRHGYKMWWHTGGMFNPNNFAGRKDNIYGNRHNVNNICLPPGADLSLIPPSMRPVIDVNDHIVTPDGQVTPSFANDATGT